MLTKGDFHIHSTASDGSLSPGEIILLAKKQGIDTLSITDHNSTDGIIEAAEFGRKQDVSVIPGVELSTRYEGESVHLLGYFRSRLFCESEFQKSLRLIRLHRFREARRLIKSVISIEVSGENISVLEGICYLRAFDASVVLAHPVRMNKRILPQLLNFPLDGIEAKYCSNTPIDTCFFINIALLRFLFYTGGSDFHTDRIDNQKHCLIGEPYLDPLEIRTFLRNSGALIL